VDKKEFLESRLLQDALVRKIELIGEAAKGLTEEIPNENNQIPWKEMMRMRDKVIHHYFRLDLDIVWLTATTNIPSLKLQVEKIIKN
jgi:uncharacterized protein with HEPN domain